ncbi:hypothetical protein OSB04_031288 [Centaurea solstitialis]|uniref:Serine aminopeptidase S33 domain-containing protein n=1 Tax=Centaurea solstitialis TaxID=347529 RepID=A0AA38SLW2_9ASTR|nr:hypothetical protein OSB04_031288 [Centaurea solstitialis]
MAAAPIPSSRSKIQDSNTVVNIVSALEKEGISAFRFDFSGNGESEGSFQYGHYRREADDLHSVIQHFHGLGRATSAILGHSKGGNVVLLYASKYHDVKCVINVCGRYNTKGGVEERLGKGFLQKVKEDGFIDVKANTGAVLYRVTEESLMDRLNTNMHEACQQIDQNCRVLTVHGSDDSTVPVKEALEFAKENSMMTDLAFALEKQGISAFRFDFSGNGESEGSFQFANYYKEVDDLHEVVRHFHKANRVVSAIIGHSKGGDVVLLYASLHHDVKTIVNVSGRYRLDTGIEQRLGANYLERAKRDGFIDVKSEKTGEVLFRVTEESLMDRLNTNMPEAALKIKQDCRVLTVHGSADDIIPVEDAADFDKIIKNHKLQIIDGADHLYKKHRAELVSAILPFIKDGIGSEGEK